MGPPCDLDSALLRLGHGLRPIKKDNERFAYVRAQRESFVAFFGMAHGLRGYDYQEE